MNTGTYTIKTWGCNFASCKYTQNFPQTRENVNIHFPGWGLTSNQCPSCKKGEIVEISGQDLSRLTKSKFLDDQEIDNLTKTDKETKQNVPLSDEEKQEKYLQRESEFKKTENIVLSKMTS